MKSFDVMDCYGIGQHEMKETHKRSFCFEIDFRGKKLRMNKSFNDSNAHNPVQYFLWFVVGIIKVSTVFVFPETGM